MSNKLSDCRKSIKGYEKSLPMPLRGKLCASHNCTGISPYSKNPAKTEVIAPNFENSITKKIKNQKKYM